MKFVYLAMAAMLSFAANAQHVATVSNCRGLDSTALMITKDFSGALIENPKTYGNGGIRIALISTDEPAAASEHLIVNINDGSGGWVCKSINYNGKSFGFSTIDFRSPVTQYVAGKGLEVILSTEVNGENGPYPFSLKFYVNQATKNVTVVANPTGGN